MDTVDRILVGIDFSEYSQPVFTYASMLARTVQAELILLNVINEKDVKALKKAEEYTGQKWAESYIDEQKKDRLRMLKDLDGRFNCGNVKTTRTVRVGEPADEIVKAALEHKVDLLVIGPKGKTNFASVLFGSVAEKLHRRSPVSLLSIRGKEHADMVCRLEL